MIFTVYVGKKKKKRLINILSAGYIVATSDCFNKRVIHSFNQPIRSNTDSFGN